MVVLKGKQVSVVEMCVPLLLTLPSCSLLFFLLRVHHHLLLCSPILPSPQHHPANDLMDKYKHIPRTHTHTRRGLLAVPYGLECFSAESYARPMLLRSIIGRPPLLLLFYFIFFPVLYFFLTARSFFFFFSDFNFRRERPTDRQGDGKCG
jgi:hypothetical protein